MIGVSLFGDDAPESLGAFSLAFVALFRIAAGETSVALASSRPSVQQGCVARITRALYL